jgi:hypothetical protein
MVMGGRSGVAGPLAEFASGFGLGLVARGYRPGSAAEQLRLLADASGWLAACVMGPGDLSEGLAERLMDERRRSGRSRLFSLRALLPLLEYLRGLGVAPRAVSVVTATLIEELVERYSAYLLGQRGLAPSTIRNNAVAESFFATLKKELVHRQSWPSRRDLSSTVFDYIEAFYNRQRRHSTLGYLSPEEYERRTTTTTNND